MSEPSKLNVPAGGPRRVADELTVVIPTLGRALLEDCLAALAAGGALPGAVVVVDQGSNPTVGSWVGALRSSGVDAMHVRSSRRGRAAGVNLGIERARTRFVAVTDDDCIVAPDWVEKLTAHLAAAPDAIVTGRVDGAGTEVVLAIMDSASPSIRRRPLLRHDSMCGGNMGAAREVLARIGPFDEDPCLRTAEDCEYSYRALRSGVPIVYAPDVAVLHYGWRDEAERAAQYRSYARSHAGFLGKYVRRGDWFSALRVPVRLFRAARRWLRGLLRGDRDLAVNGRAYVLELVPGLIAGWRSESRARRVRRLERARRRPDDRPVP